MTASVPAIMWGHVGLLAHCHILKTYARAAGNLAFPLLLVGGLFLLSRRSQGGMGGPGGNNPLAFGKSKAKFQMEPNTGITFDDVAGVDEAKQDFMEVRAQGFSRVRAQVLHGQGQRYLKRFRCTY